MIFLKTMMMIMLMITLMKVLMMTLMMANMIPSVLPLTYASFSQQAALSEPGNALAMLDLIQILHFKSLHIFLQFDTNVVLYLLFPLAKFEITFHIKPTYFWG